MLPPEDYYALLRVSPRAEPAAIRTAYRELMRRYHPDVNGSADAMATATAINEAYACLRDEERRAAYDWERNARPRAHRTGHGPARPMQPRPVWSGPTWSGPSAPVEPSTPWYQPTWGKAIGLGIAGVVTAITFTVTSFIPPVAPAAARPPVEVTMKVKATTVAPDAGSPPSRR